MSFLKKIFGKKEESVKSNADFWQWFQKNEKEFFAIIKSHKNIEDGFLNKIGARLDKLKDGYFYLTGMYDENTVELILTADGNIKNIVFVEELVEVAPKIQSWKFTALKPSLDIKDVSIEMSGYKFDASNIHFYSNEATGYPDEIDITIIHDDLTEENKKSIVTGIYIFLDNYLGEIDFVNNIDSLNIIGKKEAQKELISVAKLKNFLTWRQKEFIEKYEGARYNTEKDSYSILEAELESGSTLIAVVNTELLNWDSKASHPWMSVITFKYDGSSDNGMPNKNDYELLNQIEEELMQELKDVDGYLNIGRQTAKGEREVYFACKDFRKPSKAFYKIEQKHSGSFEIEYDIYKDKYWQSVERFNKNVV